MRRSISDEEFSLVDLFAYLWESKLIIIAFTVLMIGLGSTVAYYKKITEPEPHFFVSLPFAINLYSVKSQQICAMNNQNVNSQRKMTKCIEDYINRKFLGLVSQKWTTPSQVEREWVKSKLNIGRYNYLCGTFRMGFCLKKHVRDHLSIESYEEEFKAYNILLTEQFRSEAELELLTIENDLNSDLRGNERVATNALNANRIIKNIRNEKLVLELKEVSIEKIQPPSSSFTIIMLSAILGITFGFGFAMARFAVRKSIPLRHL